MNTENNTLLVMNIEKFRNLLSKLDRNLLVSETLNLEFGGENLSDLVTIGHGLVIAEDAIDKLLSRQKDLGVVNNERVPSIQENISIGHN